MMWRASLAAGLGLLVAASAQTTVSDYCETYGGTVGSECSADDLEDAFPDMCPALAAAGYCRGMYPSYGGCMKVSLGFAFSATAFGAAAPLIETRVRVWRRAAKSARARPDCFYSAPFSSFSCWSRRASGSTSDRVSSWSGWRKPTWRRRKIVIL